MQIGAFKGNPVAYLAKHQPSKVHSASLLKFTQRAQNRLLVRACDRSEKWYLGSPNQASRKVGRHNQIVNSRHLGKIPSIQRLDKSGLNPEANNQVYVILFGVGEVETEGIYTLKNFSDDDVSRDTVLVFQDRNDALSYAVRLNTEWKFDPHVCSTTIAEIEDFCVESGYKYHVEVKGTALQPPHTNIQVTDWERYLRLKNGEWRVLSGDPEAFDISQAAVATEPSSIQSDVDLPEVYRDKSMAEIKQALERLLPS